MPFAARTVDLFGTGDIDQLREVASKLIGATLRSRGWSLTSVVADSGTASVTFCRVGERDRDFAATTDKQWTDIQRLFVTRVRRLGWKCDLEIPVEVAAPAINPNLCRECGCDNTGYIGNCFVCGASREVKAVDTDSELRQLIANVKSAVAALENYLNR